MKKCYSVLILCLILVFPGITYAQISGPTTGTVGTPVNFSTSTGGVSYNWSFGTTNRDLNVAYTPTVVHAASLSISPNYTSMVFDGTNWYSFTISATSAAIVRGSYGANPTIAAPTLATLTTTPTHVPSNTTKGIDVVYDSTDQRWYAVIVTGWTNMIQILDFGATGLSNLAPTRVDVPVNLGADANHLITNQLTMKRWNGQWLCFIAGSGGKNFVRFDMGPNLGALNASSTPLVQRKLSNFELFNFSLYEENGNWYAIGANLSTISRFSFGADLQNNAPVATTISSNISPAVGGNFRSVMLTKGCNSQVFGYLGTGTPNTHKLNFQGSIASATITSSPLVATGGGTGADGTAGLCAFVYNDTLYAAGSRWNSGNALFLMKLLPLTNSETRYRDKTISHTFTAPGTYKVDLLIDAGAKNGPQAYCHEIVISASGPAQPGLYTAAPSPLCAGQSNVTYTVPAVSGATAYRWHYTGGNVSYTASTTQPTNSLSFAANATGGALRVWAVDNNGDSSFLSRDTAITVNALPVVAAITGTASVCVGGTTNLSNTTGGGTWLSANTAVATVNSSGQVTGVSAGTVNINYRVINASNCTTTVSLPVTVNALPVVATITGTASVCVGGTTNLSNTTGGGTWLSANTAVATVNSSGQVTGVSAGTVNINYRVINASNCTTTVSLPVTVNALPVVATITGTASVCVGGTTNLSNTTGGGTWLSANTAVATVNSSGQVTGVSAGTVNINYRVINASNCTTTVSLPVTVNVLPVVSISPASVSVCAGQSTALTASGANTYVWSPSGGNAATANVSPGTTTTYTVEGTNTSTGCKNTVSRQVTVNVLPVTQVTVTGGITEICTGDSVVLTASGSGYSYEWKEGSGNVGTGSSYAVYTTGSYKVVATDISSGCIDSTQAVDIRVYAPPVVSLEHNDTSFCIGGVVTLEVSTQDTGLTYVWKQDEATVSLATADFLEINESGVYKVIVGRSGIASCEDSTNEVTITVHDLPVVNTTWDGEVLHGTPGYVSYQWNTGSQGILGATDSTYTPSSNGGYSVTVTDGNGCENTSAVQNLTNVSVGAMDSEVVSVYPNPSGGMVYIESPVRVDVLLLSVDGRLLQRVADARQLDLNGYANGVYLLRIMDAEGVVIGTERVMKQ